MTNVINPKLFEKNTEMRATRDGFGEGLVELGEKDPRIVVLTGDVRESMRVEEFAKRWPERFVECGVAEQNMMGIAAGLAAAGKVPFVSAYAVFSPGRNWDQLRVSVAYSGLNVKVAGGHAGLSVGADGATHQALEDIAITRVLPGMTVICPCDYWEARRATIAAAKAVGPTYIRLTREKTPIVTDKDESFEIGKAYSLWDSENLQNQVAIVGCGPMLYQCLIVARELHEEGVGTKVINNHTIKPMDTAAVLKAARDCGAIVTAEEHQIMGGMGSAVAETIAAGWPVPIEMVGVADRFGESGTPEELLEKYGLSVVKIKEAVKKVIKRKAVR